MISNLSIADVLFLNQVKSSNPPAKLNVTIIYDWNVVSENNKNERENIDFTYPGMGVSIVFTMLDLQNRRVIIDEWPNNTQELYNFTIKPVMLTKPWSDLLHQRSYDWLPCDNNNKPQNKILTNYSMCYTYYASISSLLNIDQQFFRYHCLIISISVFLVVLSVCFCSKNRREFLLSKSTL